MSTPIPALLPPTSQPTTAPYLTAAQFRAYPTWLDLDNLVPGGVASLQDDDLTDALLAATGKAETFCEGMRLSAHLVTGEQVTARQNGGRVWLQPRDIPLTSVVALSYGWDPSVLNAMSVTSTTFWNEDGRLISFQPGGATQQFTGPAIQFGGSGPAGGRLWVTWSYIAGFVSTALSASCAAGASSVTVADPTGIMPGQALRIYDTGAGQTGASEALTVATTYIPQIPTVPPTATAVPLAAGTAYAHGAGTGITGMPRELIQAVIAIAVGLLMRVDVAAEEPDTGFGPAARTAVDKGSGAAGGLMDDAWRDLAKFRPVWRSR